MANIQLGLHNVREPFYYTNVCIKKEVISANFFILISFIFYANGCIMSILCCLYLGLSDENPITPSELSVLDCLFNGGRALSLKVGNRFLYIISVTLFHFNRLYK